MILTQSYWRDEAFSVLLSEKSPLDIIKVSFYDPSPPLYYLLLHFWMLLFGTDEIAVRSLSFIFHCVASVFIFLIAKKLTKSNVFASLTTLTVFLNPFLLQYAFEARAYSLLVLFLVAAIYFLLKEKILFAGIFLALSIFVHNFALFNVIAIGIWWASMHRKTLSIKKLFRLFGLSFLAIILWGKVVLNQWGFVSGGFWIPPVKPSVFLETFAKFTSGEFPFKGQQFLFTFSAILTFLALAYLLPKKKRENTHIISLFGLLACFAPLVTYGISLVRTPIYYDRYFISAVPMLILFVSLLLYRILQSRFVWSKVMLVFVGCYLVSLLYVAVNVLSTPTKAPIREGVQTVLSSAREGDIIVPKDILNFLEVKLYVEQSEKPIPVFAYSPDGKVPFYIGGILYEKKDIIRQLPHTRKVWRINPDGGYE